jgi:peptide/nickel transport system permease protein
LLRRPVAAVSCAYLGALVVVAIVAPMVLPGVGSQHAGDLLAVGQGPSLQHLLGTDSLGRDILQRLLVGTRVTVVGVLEALVVTLVLGVPFGLAAGFIGGRVDRAVTWYADLSFSVPGFVIVIVVLSIFPESMLAGMVTFGVLVSPALMRVVRSATLPIRSEQYVDAARVAGLSKTYIVTRHVLPRISGVVIVQASFLAATALVAQAGLAFLGLLVPEPAPSWGGMIADGTTALLIHPWLIWPPGILICLTILALNLLGDTVRDATTETWLPATPPRSARRAVPGPADGHALGSGSTLLSIRDLTITFDGTSGTTVVEGFDLDVAEGEAVGIVGESGSGKTMTLKAIIGLLPPGAATDGAIYYAGADLAQISERALQRVRGREIAFISQEPTSSLDPAFRVGPQLQEYVRQHLRLSRRQARARSFELLERVQLADPIAVARSYPHELSGGMAQRVAIARALAGEPRLLLADEPTSALDVTVQAEVLELLLELKSERQMAILLVTHDWSVVASACDRVAVMYAGQIVERSEIVEVLENPLHPYTRALLAADPHRGMARGSLEAIPGSMPQPGSWSDGCRFEARCTYATAACGKEPIPLQQLAPTRSTRCIHHRELVRP